MGTAKKTREVRELFLPLLSKLGSRTLPAYEPEQDPDIRWYMTGSKPRSGGDFS